ncbi:unnamed protein product [Cladocopium goreaui]|uniref:Uncharacterized protein n=1 Tax=Cladocopium goreaui TaxID=2562237 RepID=A0A9P1DC35_9DINO|nr:unnamed protein product [Cladocopium goreaui]
MSSPPPSDSKTHAHDDGLARAWEGDFNVRERMRFGAGKLLVWPKGKANAELIGQTSMQALSMNCNVLTIMAAWWCPTQTTPKTPSITVVKAQEIGVNDFYVEIFKYWTLKKPRKALSTTPAATSTSSASSTSGVEVVDLADSGDESGDLSVIMEVRDKSDPYTTIFEDSDQDCAEAAALSDEIRDYATSTMAILNDAISDAMDEEAADEIRLSPEYPGEDPYPAVEEPVTVNPKEPVPDPDMGGPVTASSSMATPADQPGVPPPAAPTRENKTFTDTQGVMTIKDVEQKILYLKQLLAQKKQMEQQPASDVADTLPFDPVPVAAALMTGSSPDAVSSSDSQDSIGTPSGICRCLAGDFSNAKRGNQQDDPPSTTSQKRSPMLIVPKNWDVPIQQRMVDIFTMAKTGAPEPPRSDPEGQRPEGPRPDCPPDPEGREPEGPQPEGPRPDCPPEPEGPRPEGPHQNGTVEKMEIDDEPPVVLRTEQWKLKPAGRGRGRGKGRGGRRGRGKACTGEIMVESSADEADEGDVESKAAAAAVPTVDEDVGKKPRRQPKDLPQPPTEPEPSTGGAGEPAEPSEPGPGGENAKVPRKRAKAGQGAAGISFARRTCPKTCPARERWRAAKAVFEEKIAPCLLELGFRKGLYEVHWWTWCMENLHEHDKVQQVTRDMETEDNEVTRSNQFHDAFVAAARVEAGNFIQENGLCMDED